MDDNCCDNKNSTRKYDDMYRVLFDGLQYEFSKKLVTCDAAPPARKHALVCDAADFVRWNQ